MFKKFLELLGLVEEKKEPPKPLHKKISNWVDAKKRLPCLGRLVVVIATRKGSEANFRMLDSMSDIKYTYKGSKIVSERKVKPYWQTESNKKDLKVIYWLDVDISPPE